MNRSNQRQAQLAAVIGTVVNILLTVGKGIIGYYGGSRALLADAIHSGADVIGSVAVMIGLRVARKPPDDDHPYGHGRAELVSSAVVALVLLAAGIEVFVTSIHALFLPAQAPDQLTAYAAAASIVIKEVLYQYNFRLGQRIHSHSLVASARDHRTDVYASVAALLGIILSILGRIFDLPLLMHMDALAGAGVAVLVVWVGYKIATEAASTLVDKVEIKDAKLAEYRQCLDTIVGVVSVDELRVRDHGQYVVVDVEIAVQAEISVAAGHDIAERVRSVLKTEFPRVVDVLVHVNPYYPVQGKGE